MLRNFAILCGFAVVTLSTLANCYDQGIG
uniref:Uncharacterized protein n=1 Tax=Pyricularia oryzae (strain P131) TaxID=1143193 RepID=L7J6E3_PYRO1